MENLVRKLLIGFYTVAFFLIEKLDSCYSGCEQRTKTITDGAIEQAYNNLHPEDNEHD